MKISRYYLPLLFALLLVLARPACAERECRDRGWQSADGDYWYCDDNQRPLRGLNEIAGSFYYFENDGTAAGGWVETVDGRYYAGARGILYTDTFKDGYSIGADGRAELIEFLPVDFGICTQGTHPTSQKLDAQIDEVIDVLTTSNMSELDQLGALYGWIISNIHYSYIDSEVEPDTFNDYLDELTQYAMDYRTGRCYHYAAISQYMLERLGVQSVVVKGYSNAGDLGWVDHYWTMVAYQGQWYHFDPMMQDDYNLFNCLLTTDARIRDFTHKWDDGTIPPSGTEKPY